MNEVICHGIPDCRKLEKGDIVNIDITVYKDGYHGDLNETFIVGKPSDIKPEYLELIKTTYDATMHAINHGLPGFICVFGWQILALLWLFVLFSETRCNVSEIWRDYR